MRISIFGLGYVGSVTAACLAARGHKVIGVDKSGVKVDLVRSGRCPIVERGMDDLVKQGVKNGQLWATTDPLAAVTDTDLSIICVGTPSRPNGSLGLDAVQQVSSEIGSAMGKKTSRHVVVVRSTVLPGTTRKLIAPWIAAASGKDIREFGIAFNPEFLREGSSIDDFERPARTIVGGLDEETVATVLSLYSDLPGAKTVAGLETAELLKYVDNSWHALKVAFANEIGLLAKSSSVNTAELVDLFLQDTKLNISAAYLRPGFAFGGSCLPKDLRAVSFLGRSLDLPLPLVNGVLESNRRLLETGIDWVMRQGKKRVAFLGVSFKAGTDDVRESPYVEMIERLIGKGFQMRIFDPNIRLDRLIGANRYHLTALLPHVADLLVSDIHAATGWAEVIVVTAANPEFEAGLARTTSDQTVLELARLSPEVSIPAKRLGFLW